MFRKLALSIVVFILLTLVFCVVGYLAIGTYLFVWGRILNEALTTWHSMGKPSEPISKIVIIYQFPVCDGGGQVYLETETGKILSCTGHDQKWHETPGPIAPVSGWYFTLIDTPGARASFIKTPGLPPGVRDTAVKKAAMLSATEFSSPIYYIVLEDNSMWRWEVNHSLSESIFLLLLGLLGGGYLFVVVWSIRRLYKKPTVKEVVP